MLLAMNIDDGEGKGHTDVRNSQQENVKHAYIGYPQRIYGRKPFSHTTGDYQVVGQELWHGV